MTGSSFEARWRRSKPLRQLKRSDLLALSLTRVLDTGEGLEREKEKTVSVHGGRTFLESFVEMFLPRTPWYLRLATAPRTCTQVFPGDAQASVLRQQHRCSSKDFYGIFLIPPGYEMKDRRGTASDHRKTFGQDQPP